MAGASGGGASGGTAGGPSACPPLAAFRPTAGSPTEASTGAPTAPGPDRVFLGGNPMLVYDHATETFRLGGSLLTPRPEGGPVSTALSDGRVLVTGGQIGFHTVTAAAEISIRSPRRSRRLAR